METLGIIRKISVGDIKEGITYKVGQQMLGGRILIEQILKDYEALGQHGINTYHIYVSENGSDVVRIWKTFEDMPVSVEYDISIERNA